MFLLSSFASSIQFICIVGLLVVVASFILKRIKQPTLVAYILIGAVIGSDGFDLIQDRESIKFIGELGIILLFFFIGMEVDLKAFVTGWKLAFFGTLTQILLSILSVYGLGLLFDWPTNRVVVLGFVIALSSSAVIFKLLDEKKLMQTKLGQNVTHILLSQDIALAPILICIAIIGGNNTSVQAISLKVLGGVVLIGIMIYVYIKEEITWLPFKRSIKKDHELQVFLALFFCFAGALIAGLFGLSEALGAFVGGLVMHAGKATAWVHEAIHSFRVLFVAIFFISIGAQLQLAFIYTNWVELSSALFAVYITNHLINTFILRAFKNSWSDAILGGALLAQIGELSFLICASAFTATILSQYAYDFTIALISLTICISPIWIILTEYSISKLIKSSSIEKGIV